MAEKIKMTQEGYNDLQNTLKELQGVKLAEVAQKLKEARSFGDLSENAEYTAALEEQANIGYKIGEIKAKLENAEIVNEEDIADDIVSFGSYVKIYSCEKDSTCIYRILGASEADYKNGIISEKSPLAKALLGHKKGTKVTVNAPKHSYDVKIMAISKNKLD